MLQMCWGHQVILSLRGRVTCSYDAVPVLLADSTVTIRHILFLTNRLRFFSFSSQGTHCLSGSSAEGESAEFSDLIGYLINNIIIIAQVSLSG